MHDNCAINHNPTPMSTLLHTCRILELAASEAKARPPQAPAVCLLAWCGVLRLATESRDVAQVRSIQMVREVGFMFGVVAHVCHVRYL